MSVSHLGYKSLSMPVNIVKETELDPLVMEDDTIGINEVIVKSKMPVIRRDIDRFIVDMRNSVIVKNKSILQSLNYTPGVIVGRNKEITLNGKSNVVVMINGKKLNMSSRDVSSFLENLRGEEIERIEVISNPGVQYDSEGQGGVIDIYLKRSSQQGIDVSIYGTLSKAHNIASSSGASLNFNIKNLTVYGSLGYAKDKDYYKIEESMTYPETQHEQQSLTKNLHDKNTYNYRSGLHYAINGKHSLSLEVYGNYSLDSMEGHSQVHITDPRADSIIDMLDNLDAKNTTTSYSLNYKFNIGPNGRNLSFIGDYTIINQEHQAIYDYSSNRSMSFLKNHDSKNDYNIYSYRLDYSHPFNRNIELSSGLKYSLLKTNIDESLFDYENTIWIVKPDYTYRFDYKEQLAAMYVNLTYKFKKIEGALGLRGEFNKRDSEHINKEEFQLFPSILSKYNATDNLYFSASYGRRINRPAYRSLVPYYFFSTPYTVKVGNPDLIPSIVSAFAFNVGYKMYSISVSYDNIRDNIYFLSDFESDNG